MVNQLAGATPNEAVDVAIVTVLHVERNAVRDRLDEYDIIQDPGDIYTYYLGTIAIPGSHDAYRVVVVQLLDPGNVEAAIAAARLLQRWHPRNVLMVGIAGGVATAGVRLGDVVVARNVHYYEPAKDTPAGEQIRSDEYFSDLLLRGRAQSYEAADWKDEVRVEAPTEHQGFVPRAHFGTIASGERVIADQAALDALRQRSPKLMAVAMEGVGIARAVAGTDSRFLEVRGISDLADQRKDDRWHDYAANAVAAFVVGFLRSRPIPSLQEEERLRADTHAGTSGPPLVILRAQSLRPIRPDELLIALPVELRARDHITIPLDFTDLSSQTKVTNPEAALTRLLDQQDGLMAALAVQEGELVFHGLIAIPLAFLAGYVIGDRQPVKLFDYHPDLETWSWPEDLDIDPPLQVTGLPTARAATAGEVVVRVSVTFQVASDATAVVVPHPIAAIDLAVPEPRRNLIRSEAQTREYGRVFRQALDQIVRVLPNTTRVHVFYSGPVALAFRMGQQVSENIHPPVTVWNYGRGYDWGIDLESVSRGDGEIVRPE